MKKGSPRVAFFPCVYHEVDGVAQTSRHFEAFARRQELPFLMVHAGPVDEVTPAGPVTRVQLPRGPVKFPLDRAHDYDLLFLRHYRKLEPLLRDFRPDVGCGVVLAKRARRETGGRDGAFEFSGVGAVL